jgi:hypothetical protein
VNVRSVQLRALLLPLCVAIASMAALAWYGFVWIPSQQKYLNERNFRLLRTLGAQIKTKVDNFDGALDHALKSLDGGDKLSSLKELVRRFAPDLEVLAVTEHPPAMQDPPSLEQSVLSRAGDPPRVQLQRDEGRNYLYLGLKQKLGHGQQTVFVLAKADLENATAPYLTPRPEFDALLLVSRNGRVIAQESPQGLKLARVDRLASAARAQAANPDGNNTPSNIFESLWLTSNTHDVTIGDADYKLYVQSVPLSLVRLNAATDEAEEWAVCGLVRTDKFRAESSALSYNYVLLFMAALAGILFTIPLLKLHVLSPHERLRNSDGVWVAAAVFLVTGLLTFGLLDAYYFAYDFRNVTDAQLKKIAFALRSSFWKEASQIDEQLRAFEDSRLWASTLVDMDRHRSSSSENDAPRMAFTRGVLSCQPREACKDRVLARPHDAPRVIYPYFDLATWNDGAGWQRIKWSATRNVTPFLNLKEEKVDYYPELERAARRFDGASRSGISAIASPNTGQPVTVFWQARDGVTPGESPTGLIGRSLALFQPPLSLDRPVLPPGVQFAVITNNGQVIFHSDGTRNLKENFVQECEDNAALRAALAAGRDQALSVNYLGRPHRLQLTPLATDSSRPTFTDPNWSLAVFQDTIVPQTLNLESLTLAVALFAMFGATLGGAWCLQFALQRQGAAKWFWPDDRKGARYRFVAWTNGLLGVLSIVVIALLTSTSLLVATGLLVIIALGATYIVVVRIDRPAATGDAWQQPFLWARVSLLFVVSAVPAIACFHVAYDFETGLFIRSGQMYLAKAGEARQDSIRQRLQPLFRDTDREAQLKRVSRPENSLEISPSPFFEASRETDDTTKSEPFTRSRLDGWLLVLHRFYNEVAVDPVSVFPDGGDANAPASRWQWRRLGPTQFSLAHTSHGRDALTATTKTADVNGWYAPIVVGLVGALYVLLRFGVQPLYALELYPSPGIAGTGHAQQPAANLLLIGPPGSGKTARLRQDPTNLVFDVRTRAFIDRRRHARPVQVERRMEPFDGSNLPGCPDAVICIDHLEHRFDEPAVRDFMLSFMEDLIYRHKRRVWVAADREPLGQLRKAQETRPAPTTPEADANNGPAVDLDRWAQVFQSFRLEIVGVAGQPTSDGQEHALEARGFDAASADPYYRSVWSSCSSDEKLALRQLADEGVVNPRNHIILEQLLRKGLARRDSTFRVMNETFRRFIVRETPAEQVDAWEHQGVKMPWSTIRTTLATVALGLLGLLVLTQQQLLYAWVGYVPALAPAVPTVLKLFASLQHGPKAAILNV